MSGELGRLVLQFAADVAGFQSDLGRVERAAAKSAKETAASFDKAVSGLTGSIKGAAGKIGASLAAAFTVNALKDFVKAGIDVADQINEVGKKTGISTEALSGLKFAAEQSGVSFESLSSALIKMEVNAAKAAGGNEKLDGIFKALGVSVKTASGEVKNGNLLFTELSGAFSKLQNGPEKNAAGIEIFGKSFAKLIPLLNEGPEGLANFTKEAERLGLIVNSETGQSADDFGDALAAVGSAAEGAGLALAKELLPNLIVGAKLATDFVVAFRDSGSIDVLAASLNVLIGVVERVGEAFSAAQSSVADGLETFDKFAALPQLRSLLNQVSPQNAVVPPKADAASVVPPKAEVNSVEAALRSYRAELSRVRGESKLTGASSQEFVKAVKVLSLDKSVVGTPKELALAIRGIREELNPTLKMQREYDEKVIQITKSTEADTNQKERNRLTLIALKKQLDANIKAYEDTKKAQDSSLISLTKQIQLLKGNAFGHEAAAREARIQAEYQRLLNADIQNGIEINGEYRESLRKQVEALDDLQNYKTFDLGTAIAESINEGFTKASLGAGFKSFFDKVKKAFSGSAEQVADSIASVANTLSEFVAAANGSDGNALGEVLRTANTAVAQANIPYASAYARAAQAIDVLFQGKLFGTDFTRQSQLSTATFGANGFDARSTTVDTRQRSFFRGRQTRTTTTQAEAEILDAGAQFQSALDDISRTIAEAFGTDLTSRVNASFVQSFDQTGLVSTIATVGGRVVAAGTQAAFEQFLTAQTIIDALKPTIQGLDALADPFRTTGKDLAEFARFALGAQTDITRGASLLDEGSSFADLIPIITGLASGSEELLETYQRVFQSVGLLDDALAAIGGTSELTRAEFVNFSANLVTALGGISDASAIIGRNLSEFFSEAELRATKLSNARGTLSGLGESTGLGILSSEAFKEILSQALAGAFDAERTADILAYGDALALVNGLVRDITAANEAAVQAELAILEARKQAAASLGEFVTALQDQAKDGSLTNYQRTIATLNRQYAANAENLLQLARAAGLTAAPIEGVTANLSILAQGAARALGDLKVSVLQGLDSLFGSQSSSFNNFGALNDLLSGNAVETQNWAQQLRDLETLQSTQDLARNIADLFDASGLSFASGVQQYGVPLRALLDNLGVDFANLTSAASIDAFGAAASLLGVSAAELSSIAGIDLSGLSQAQITALDVASAPQVDAAESSANSLSSIDEKSTSVITLLMQQNTVAREQSDRIDRLASNVSSFADEVRRLANRVPSA
jgi:hypothetical protein